MVRASNASRSPSRPDAGGGVSLARLRLRCPGRLRWLALLGGSLAAALTLCACGAGAQRPPASESADDAPLPPVVAALRFVEAPDEGPGETPRTRILLVLIDPERGRTTTDLGTYDGACTPVDPPDGELLSASCWWGPVGARLAIRRAGQELVVTRAEVAEVGGGQAAAEEVARVPVPEGVRLDVLSRP